MTVIAVYDNRQSAMTAYPASHVSGKRLLLPADAGFSLVKIQVNWQVVNNGELSGRVGIRFNLMTDAGIGGDQSQLIIEANGSRSGSIATPAIGVTTNYPFSIAPGGMGDLSLRLDIPASLIFEKQGFQFNWWTAETTVRDVDANVIVSKEDGSQARDEIRDWFKLQETVQAFIPRAKNTPYPTYSVSVFP